VETDYCTVVANDTLKHKVSWRKNLGKNSISGTNTKSDGKSSPSPEVYVLVSVIGYTMCQINVNL